MADEESGTEKQKTPISPIIILVLATLFLVWLVAMFLDPGLFEEYSFGQSKEIWVYMGSLIMIVLIIVLLVAGFPAREPEPQTAAQPKEFLSVPQTAPEEEEPEFTQAPVRAEAESPMDVVEAEPLVVEAEIVEAEIVEEEKKPKLDTLKRKPKIVEYPKKVPGGVYGDTIIRVGPTTKLNLRTLLVRSCLICDRQGKCWEEVQDSISRDDFLENIECKKGLRKLRGGEEKPKKMKKRVVMKVKKQEEE